MAGTGEADLYGCWKGSDFFDLQRNSITQYALLLLSCNVFLLVSGAQFTFLLHAPLEGAVSGSYSSVKDGIYQLKW